jgi:hypothetical protein
VPREVEHDRRADRLSAVARPGTAREHRHAEAVAMRTAATTSPACLGATIPIGSIAYMLASVL